jgi:hypothetical protein
MTRMLLGLMLVAAVVVVSAGGCQSTGSRDYDDSDSHAGHSH